MLDDFALLHKYPAQSWKASKLLIAILRTARAIGLNSLAQQIPLWADALGHFGVAMTAAYKMKPCEDDYVTFEREIKLYLVKKAQLVPGRLVWYDWQLWSAFPILFRRSVTPCYSLPPLAPSTPPLSCAGAVRCACSATRAWRVSRHSTTRSVPSRTVSPTAGASPTSSSSWARCNPPPLAPLTAERNLWAPGRPWAVGKFRACCRRHLPTCAALVCSRDASLCAQTAIAAYMAVRKALMPSPARWMYNQMTLRYFSGVSGTRDRIKELRKTPSKVVDWKDELVPQWHAYKAFTSFYINYLSRARRKLAMEANAEGRAAEYYPEALHRIWTQHKLIDVERGDLDDTQYRIKLRQARRKFWIQNRAALYDRRYLSAESLAAQPKRALATGDVEPAPANSRKRKQSPA